MANLRAETRPLCSGDHVCAATASAAQRVATIAHALAEGLHRGEQASYAGPAEDLAAVQQELAHAGLPVASLLQGGTLHLVDAAVVYRGGFDGDLPERLLAAIDHATANAQRLGFRGSRIAGYGYWNERENVDQERLERYERAVSRLLAGRQATAVCVYDRRRASAASVRTGLRTHEQAWLGGRLRHNPFADPGALEGPREVSWMINQIIRGDDSAAELQEKKRALIHEASRLSQTVAVYEQENERLLRGMALRDELLRAVAQRWPATAAGGPPRFTLAEVDGTADDPAHGRRFEDALQRAVGCLGPSEPAVPQLVDLRQTFAEALLRAERASGHPIDVDPGDESDAVRGTWAAHALGAALERLLAVAHAQSWGTPLRTRIEALGPKARVAIRYLNLEAGTSGGSAGTDPLLTAELFVPRELIRRLGGTLGVATWPDGSTAFTVELPRYADTAPSDPLRS